MKMLIILLILIHSVNANQVFIGYSGNTHTYFGNKIGYFNKNDNIGLSLDIKDGYLIPNDSRFIIADKVYEFISTEYSYIIPGLLFKLTNKFYVYCGYGIKFNTFKKLQIIGETDSLLYSKIDNFSCTYNYGIHYNATNLFFIEIGMNETYFSIGLGIHGKINKKVLDF